MKTVLITGGAGFIGSNFIRFMRQQHPNDLLINMDDLTYAGNVESLSDVMNDPNHVFVKGSISDRSAINAVFKTYDVDWVVNFAAESHVDRSIMDPEIFLRTNVIGTQILLDAARKNWAVDPSDKYCREYKRGVKFLQISTDEVYGTLGSVGRFVESFPLNPNSPYSASKASADLLVRSYRETYGMPVIITRCSNNFGPFQFPEKLIPLMICNILQDKPLPIYGDGMQVRDWLYVYDHCAAIDLVLQSGCEGEIYNIGGNNEKTNIEIVRYLLNLFKKPESLIQHVKDRPGHDRRYAVDCSKISNELGWKPTYDFDQGMKETVEWYLSNSTWIKNIISGDYQNYYSRMYSDTMKKS